MNLAALRFTWFYTWMQLRLRHRYTYLGLLWNFLEPALYLTVLSLVFSVVNRMNLSDYAVFLFSALVPWRYLENSVNSTMISIVGGDWLLKKTPASPFVLPMARWLICSVEFLFAFAVMLLLLFLLKAAWTVHLLILPLSAVPWAIFALGAGLICAVLYTFFRDVKPVVQTGLMFTFFTSPILFTADLFRQGSLQAHLLRWHPMTYFAALFQKPIYLNQWPGVADWAVSCAVGGAVLGLGVSLVRRFQSKFYFYL